MKIISLMILSLSLFLVGCMMARPNEEALFGHWKSGVVQTEWGEMQTEITFHRNGRLEFKMKSVPSGEITGTGKGKYQWKDNKLTSEVFNKGNPVDARLGKDQLTITVGSEAPVEFVRTSTE